MSDLNWIQIAGIVGTIAPLVTIAIALYAVGSWKRTLEQQRADECVSAARYLEGAVGRLVSLRLNRKMPPLEDSSREMWDGWRKFIQAYTVAQRYHKALSEEMLADIFRRW